MLNDLVKTRTTCRGCGSSHIILSVPLAKVPIVSPNVDVGDEEYVKTVAPLDTYLCTDCGLIQLIHVVAPALIYRNYLYRTAISKGLTEHFGELSKVTMERLSLTPSSFVTEFGSNDGTLLNFYKQAGMKVQGVDPAGSIAQQATERGIPTRADFFNPAVAKEILDRQGEADLILSNNVMANIDELGPILEGIRIVLKDSGAYVFETQYALDVFQKNLLDVIYHEHISCFSVKPVVKLFERFGLQVFDAERVPTKGGSIRFWVQHAGGPWAIAPRVSELVALEASAGLYDMAYHKKFSEHIESLKNELHRRIAKAKAAGHSVAAYGTSVGCAALIHQFELEDKLDFMLDDTPFKDRLIGPGYNLPIHQGDSLSQHNPALVIVLAWRYADGIAARHSAYAKNGGVFLVPLPSIREG